MTGSETGRPEGWRLSFCERSTATAFSKEHIRWVGAEGLKFGGGAPDTTLCGAPLGAGWDLQSVVDVPTVRRLGSPRLGDGRVFLCADCRDEALRILDASPAQSDNLTTQRPD